ncbi:MAG: hypothetical protein CSA68_00295 [Rhodobacterales bacterium]|nr:MAG: hypothetical protein CSA68_00295 [Rhodobacterales bacterium]
MIELYQFKPALGLPNASPFCMKAEAYLLYRDIPYTIVPTSPRQSPSGKLPYIRDDGKLITDSEAIMDHCEATQPAPLDSDLSDKQRAESHMLRLWVEQNLFWQIVYTRWADPVGWGAFKPILSANMPRLIGGPLIMMIRRKLLQQLRSRGLNPHDPNAAYARGRAQLDVLARFLGEEGFAFGPTPSRLDMTLYAFIANVVEQDQPNELRDYARTLARLNRYCADMHALSFAKAAA